MSATPRQLHTQGPGRHLPHMHGNSACTANCSVPAQSKATSRNESAGSPATALSCLLALEDVGLDNGPVVLIPRSHHKGQRPVPAAQGGGGGGRSMSSDSDGSTVVKLSPTADELAAATPILMKAGQLLVMHAQMMHASDPNTAARPRRVLFNRYADADAVEAYNSGRPPRLGRLLCGATALPAVAEFEATAESWAASVEAAAAANRQREAARQPHRL